MEPPIVCTTLNPGPPGLHPGDCQPAQVSNDRAPGGHQRTAWQGYSNTIATGWMMVSTVCVTLAFLMRVGDGRQVHFLNWSSAIPETCMLHHRFGIDCPGCGLTRCFIHMAHGQPLQALSLSAVGIAVFFFTLVQIPLGFSQVVLRQRNSWIEQWGRWNDWIVAALLLALLLQWLTRLCLISN